MCVNFKKDFADTMVEDKWVVSNAFCFFFQQEKKSSPAVLIVFAFLLKLCQIEVNLNIICKRSSLWNNQQNTFHYNTIISSVSDNQHAEQLIFMMRLFPLL